MSSTSSKKVMLGGWVTEGNKFRRIIEDENTPSEIFERDLLDKNIDEDYEKYLSSLEFAPVSVLQFENWCLIRIHKINNGKVDIDNVVIKKCRDIDVAKLRASVIASNMGYGVKEL